jgi:TonB family protein
MIFTINKLKKMSKIVAFFCILLLISCSQTPPRDPIQFKLTQTKDGMFSEVIDVSRINDKGNSCGRWSSVLHPLPIPNFYKSGLYTIPKIKENCSLDSFFNQLFKPAQTIQINYNRDTTITFVEGTKIHYTANSMINENSDELNQNVIDISLKEFYKKSDMVLNGLTTMSGKDLLESDGMIHISVRNKMGNMMLKADQSLDIEMPTKDKKEDMQLFNGVMNENGTLDWKIQETASEILVEKMAEFPGGEEELYKYIMKNVNYPDDAIERNIEGRVYVEFVVSSNGSIQNIRVAKGVSKSLDKEAIRVISTMPNWIPARFKSKAISMKYAVPIIFELVGEVSSRNSSHPENIRTFYSDTSILKTDVNRLHSYFFSTSKLGWINCDRFTNYKNEDLVSKKIIISNPENTRSIIVFNSMKSIIFSDDKLSFQNLPKGLDISLYVISFINYKPHLAIRKMKMNVEDERDFDFKEITVEGLKDKMRKLDN